MVAAASTLLCLCGVSSVSAQAESTNLSQRILPLNCIFETVNDGTGTLHFLTPEACGVLVPPTPPIVEPTDLQPSDSTNSTPVNQPISLQPQATQQITSVPLPVAQPTPDAQQPPKQSSEAPIKARTWWQRNHKTVLVASGATLAVVLLVLLLILL
jgi:hypothetical protein